MVTLIRQIEECKFGSHSDYRVRGWTTHHTILAGLEYISTSSDQDRFNAFWSTSLSDKETFTVSRPLGLGAGIGINAEGLSVSNDFSIDLNDDTRVTVDVVSAFLQDEIELNERLSAVVGLRFDQFDIEVINVPADDLRTGKDREVSPRFGLIYKWSEYVFVRKFIETFLQVVSSMPISMATRIDSIQIPSVTLK